MTSDGENMFFGLLFIAVGVAAIAVFDNWWGYSLGILMIVMGIVLPFLD